MNYAKLKDPEVREIIKAAIIMAYSSINVKDITIDNIVDTFLSNNTPKPVLLKTEDGIEITDPEQFLFCVNFPHWLFLGDTTKEIIKYYDLSEIKIFSTPEARDNYILWNKPLLSGKEIKELLINNRFASTPAANPAWVQFLSLLEDLLKSKM